MHPGPLATFVRIDKSNLLDLLIAMVEAGLIRRNTGGHIVTYSLAPQPTCRNPTACLATAQPPQLPDRPP